MKKNQLLSTLALCLLCMLTSAPLLVSCSKDNPVTNNGSNSDSSSDSSSSESSSDCSTYSQSSGTNTSSSAAYCSTSSDENAVKVSGGTFTMTNSTVTKSGDCSDLDDSSFYGTNSAVMATDGGTINISGGTITTNGKGCNGIMAYGGTIVASDVTINTSQQASRGIHATYGGSITASNLTITTQSTNCSVIALDRGGGTVTVEGGTYKTSGNDSAVLYSTGTLSVSNITGSSENGEIGVIEGDNSITIENSNLTSNADGNYRGLMILQSGSGDGGQGLNGVITVTGGSLTLTNSETPLIEIVTNANGTVTLNGVSTTIPSGVLMQVDYNTRWSTNGATGNLILSGSGTTYTGAILTDSYSSANVTVNSGVIWEGAYDSANTGKSTSLSIAGGTWNLTANSYVDKVTLTDNATINKNGYTLTYSSLTQTSGTIND